MNPPNGMPAADHWPHGVRARYVAGCRCDECRAATAAYERKRARIRRREGADVLVEAKRARKHLKKLSKRGVGRRAVCAAADVGNTTLQEIIAGTKTHIRRSTEKRILEIDVEAASDAAHTDATETWRLLNQLLGRGWSKAELARRLGYQRPALQVSKTQVLIRTAHKVKRLHAQLIKQEPSSEHCRCREPIELERDDGLWCARCDLPQRGP